MLSYFGPKGYECEGGKASNVIADSTVLSSILLKYRLPYNSLILLSQLARLTPSAKVKASHSSEFNPYADTFENKLNWVSARFTPSNVVLTSLVSLNTSATFKTLSTFAITDSWTLKNSILSLVIPETPTLFDKVTASVNFWVTTVSAGISWPRTLSPARTFWISGILSSEKYMYFLSPPWSPTVITSTEFGKNGKVLLILK